MVSACHSPVSNDCSRTLLRVQCVVLVRCAQTFGLLGSLLVIGYATHGLILIVAPFLATFYYFLQRKYRRSSRELKRLDSVSRSPVYVCVCTLGFTY